MKPRIYIYKMDDGSCGWMSNEATYGKRIEYWMAKAREAIHTGKNMDEVAKLLKLAGFVVDIKTP